MYPSIYPRDPFGRAARWTARAAGHPTVFTIALLIIVLWAASGPLFHYSDTWQLLINTGTTVVTFLVVVLIQNTQNRDSEAMHLKLDELIRAVEGAHNALLDLEELTQEDLDRVKERYEALAQEARESLRAGRRDTGRPEVKISPQREVVRGPYSALAAATGRGACSSSWMIVLRRLTTTASTTSTSVMATTVRRTAPGSGRMTTGAMRIATRFMTLMMGLSAGPAVSFSGSPTVSPMTPALWASLPFPPR